MLACTSESHAAPAEERRVDFGQMRISIFVVKATCSISDLSRNPAAIVRQSEKKGAVGISRNGRIVGFVVSRDRLEAMLETLDILADPDAMKAIRNYEAGRGRFKDVSCLDDDES
jgi:prevent-host-death family protein